VDVSEDAYAVI